MFKLSEYYTIYEEDLKSIIQQLNLKIRTKEYLAQQEQVKLMLQEAGKCIQQMQMELSTLSLQQKIPLERTLNQYRQQLANIEKQVKVVHNEYKPPAPDQNLRSDLIENDKIIDEIDTLTQETQNIAITVNQRMGDGTHALHSAKNKKEELKANVRKADLIISMMNRKISVDKDNAGLQETLLQVFECIHELNKQLKLMIKPPERMVKLTAAFIQLLAGTLSSIPNETYKIDWNTLKQKLKNPMDIMEIINNQAVFLKRVRQDNLEKSKQILQEIQDKSSEEMFDTLYECILDLQMLAKPLFKNIYQKKAQSAQRLSAPKQQSQPKILQQSNRKVQIPAAKRNLSSSKISNHSSSSRASSAGDLQARVQSAQDKKKTRLDKILGLSVSKPQAQSQVKQIVLGQSVSSRKTLRSNSKEQVLRKEIESNYQEIKQIRHKENELKWKTEREAKQIREQEIKKSLNDQIVRYKQSYEKEQIIKKEQRKLSQQSKIATISRGSTHQTNESNDNSIEQLQQDYLFSSKLKSEMEASLNKIINNISKQSYFKQ